MAPDSARGSEPVSGLSGAGRRLLAPEEALAFWLQRINYEERVPQPDDLKLDRMRELARRLGDPQQRLRIVHVAGSKGKGSVSALLAAILQRAGYRTGLFTSPHLVRVEERFQVDGLPIHEAEVTALLSDIYEAVHKGLELALTFFEVATALGFLHFVRRRVDVAVMEVGLGGRFDSTNICQPEVAVIASISFDHTRQLGNRLASIAMEKAGIVKPGRPTISGATAPEARAVIQRICRDRGSPLAELGRDFHFAYQPAQVNPCLAQADFLRRPRTRIRTPGRTWPEMELGLLGEHQAANAAVVVACIEHLRAQGWHIPDQAVFGGAAEVRWPARLEIVRRQPLIVLDCAHNVASAQALVDTLQQSFPPGRRLLLFAASNDKDIPGMLRILSPHFDQAFLTRYSSNPRSVPPEELAELWQRNGNPAASIHATPRAALQAALAAAGANDLLCVAGSVFLAGELRPELVP